MKTLGIAVVPPWRETEHLRDLPRLCTEGGFSELGFMIQCHPESFPLTQKIEESLERFRKAAEVVRKIGVKPGILLQTLVNHGERHQPLSEVGFKRIVGEDGAVCEACFCPADEGFRDYIEEITVLLAKAGPDFLLVDDDFRLSHHAPARYGCFCDTHLELLATEFGEGLSREELIGEMGADSDRGVDVRRAWLAVRRESYLGAFRRMRQAIDSVDPAIRCGFANVRWNADVTEEAARCLAGETQPFARLNAGIYLDSSPSRFAGAMVQTAALRAMLPEDVICYSEADTCPHTRYSMSASALHAYIAGTLMAGADGAKLWIANCLEWYLEESDRYRQILQNAGPFFDQIIEITRDTEWLGPSTPQLCKRLPELTWRPDESMWNGLIDGRNWAAALLGRYGMPWKVTGDPTCTMLAGKTAMAYSPNELQAMFSGALVLDGEAAGLLSEMGYDHLMGVRLDASEKLRISYERYSDDVELHGRYAATSLRINAPGVPRLVPIASGVRIVSSFVAVPHYQSLEESFIAPSVTLFENELGGRVAVYATIPGHGSLASLNDRAKEQLIGVLSWIQRKPLPVWTEGTADVLVRYGRLDDENTVLAVINLNPDAIAPLQLGLPGPEVTGIERLLRDGTWSELAFEQSGERIRIDVELPLFDTFVAKIHAK